jgi:hypothetical protein
MLGDLVLTAGALIGLLLAGQLEPKALIVLLLVMVVVQGINWFAIETVVFRKFGLWFMPCFYLALIWLMVAKYASLALSGASLGFFLACQVVVTAYLIPLKRHRFDEWFSGFVKN